MGIFFKCGQCGPGIRFRRHPIAQPLKDLCLKLEKQGLAREADALWQEVLARPGSSAREKAKIWYRVGKLRQEQGDYGPALAAYYRSESLAELTDLASEINRRVEECLEGAGRFSALRYELEDRVSVGGEKKSDAVLAEIGSQKITRAEVDRRIEEQIDRQLASMARFVPAEQRRQQRQTLLKRFAAGEERQRLLQQMILEEMLYRKAREDGLAEVQEVRDLLRDTERSLLASQVMDRTLRAEIRISTGDIETLYQATREKYAVPAAIRVSHILVKSKEEAEALLAALAGGKKFDHLAKELSLDPASKSQGGRIQAWIPDGAAVSGLDLSAEDLKAVHSTAAGKVIERALKTSKGFHVLQVNERRAASTKPFSEVQTEVYRELRARKEQEVQGRLFAELKERYNVVLHAARLTPDPEVGKTPSATRSTEPPLKLAPEGTEMP